LTGDVWFPALPLEWQAERLKHAVAMIDRKTDGAVGETSYLGLENVESWTGRQILIGEPLSSVGLVNQYRLGDVLFAKLRPYLAKATLAGCDGICSTEFIVMRPNKLIAKYLLYAVLSGAFIDAVNAWTYGVKMPRASWDIIGNFLFPIPPIDRQLEIVDFLDRETAEADALVAKYERLIELLEEKRVALITHAVTKGLDPDVPMKDSGIEWIGAMPAHWNILRLRFLCRVGTGGRDTVDAVDGAEFPFFVRSQTVERIDSYAYDREAILTAGDGAGVGKVFHHFTGKFNAHQRVYILSSFKNVNGAFLHYYLKTNFYKVALEGGAKSTVDSLRMPVFLNFPVTIPSIDEQMQIMSYVNDQSSKLDALIDCAKKSVVLTREHRSALITAAATGQIDVRTYRSSKQQPIKVSA